MRKDKYVIYIDKTPVPVSEEVYREYKRAEEKEQYFMKRLKKGKVSVDRNGNIDILPAKEIWGVLFPAGHPLAQQNIGLLIVQQIIPGDQQKARTGKDRSEIRRSDYVGSGVYQQRGKSFCPHA